MKIANNYGNSIGHQQECLEKCKAYAGAIGCELNWSLWGSGCYVHTRSVVRGNNAEGHLCWVLSKCQGGQGLPVPAQENYQYVGCFKDSKHNRDLGDGILTSSNSLEFCSDRCTRKGYKYFGVQYGNNCWCGNSYNRNPVTHARVPDSECNMPCSGNAA